MDGSAPSWLVESDIDVSYPVSGGYTPVNMPARPSLALSRDEQDLSGALHGTHGRDALRHGLERPRVRSILPVHQWVKQCSCK